MNYAALLGVVAAAAFTLPLLAHAAQLLGLPRVAGVAVSLATALLAAGVWYWRARRAERAARRSERRPTVNAAAVPDDRAVARGVLEAEERDASV